MNKPMKSLADKLAEKKVIEDAKVKVDDEIDSLQGEKKVKISKNKKK